MTDNTMPAAPERQRCAEKKETLRWGRHVADYKQCTRLAAPGERYCAQHGGKTLAQVKRVTS